MMKAARWLVCLFLALTPVLGGCSSGGEAAGDAPADRPAAPGGSTPTGGATDPGAGTTGMPCDVAAAIETACVGCHSSPPKYGAPMPLTTLDDIHKPSVSDPSRPVYEVMLERMKSETKPMPPKGDIADADRAALETWLGAGAPESKDSCDPGTGTGGPGEGAVGPDALPCTPTHVITAHAAGSKDKYHVPESGAENEYECFTFKSPFDGKTQATAWAPIIDDERVLHHWILWRTTTPQIDGGVGPCNMGENATTFVAGWAPGGENAVMPENVGLELAGPNDYFILQLHYHNAAHYTDADDASGVAFCTTDTPRENLAGVVTLGTMLIGIPPHAKDWETTGNCPSLATSATMKEPLTVIATFPHMHELGRKFKTDILRGGSTSDVDNLSDVQNFSFDDQGFYPLDPPVVIQPGDALTTTCTYDNPGAIPVTFGENTENEMCFNFALAYPIDSLTQRKCMF